MKLNSLLQEVWSARLWLRWSGKSACSDRGGRGGADGVSLYCLLLISSAVQWNQLFKTITMATTTNCYIYKWGGEGLLLFITNSLLLLIFALFAYLQTEHAGLRHYCHQHDIEQQFVFLYILYKQFKHPVSTNILLII